MKTARLARMLVYATVAIPAFAAAGPPYVTDDPEPVELHHWELYLATQGGYDRDGNLSFTAPHVEVNYVASHEFRRGSYFATDPERVCEACHTGFNRPAMNAYYWIDQPTNNWAVVKATGVKRHPQATELTISGSTTLSPATGGTNNVHASFACADCHGTGTTATGDVHGLPGLPYVWALNGDVQCSSCHGGYVHTEPVVGAHLNGSFTNGTKVACIGCHSFGLARDFEIAKTGASTSHEVFIDPETGEVRPVVWKNGHAIAWYSHNWQTFDPGTGKADPNGHCAQKCHYSGNLVGAGF